MGAVLLGPADGAVEYYGAIVSPELVRSWCKTDVQLQVIGQAELYPKLVSRLTWGARLKGYRAIYFMDNESDRLQPGVPD